jgi:hypothetical protein
MPSWFRCALAALMLLPLVPGPSTPWSAPRSRIPTATLVIPGSPARDAAAPGTFDAGRSAFEVRFGDQRVPYRVMGVFALPAEVVPIDLDPDGAGSRIEAAAGTVTRIDDRHATWTAPTAAGVTPIRIVTPDGHEAVTLHAFVLVPYAEMKHGMLRGYRVGGYPAPRPDQAEERPRGFIAITDETAPIQVSPHFRLEQFACKSGSGLPKYAVVQPRLLLRLEGLLDAANRTGIPIATFELLSGYRTPLYNREIGNETRFTRHQYGDAADIYVDENPRDGRMDDLNRDGRLDRADAIVLERLAAATEDTPEEGGAQGGLAAYPSTGGHGAFVHVDTRGYRARW